MIVSIGLLACNEALVIEATLRSLLAQSAFRPDVEADDPTAFEVIVVANGCNDDTAGVAERVLAQLGPAARALLRSSVVELSLGDKCNAWNHFVHNASADAAEMLVLVDADIELGHPDTLRNCLALLRNDTAVDIAVDRPLKTIARKPDPSWRERLSLRQSRMDDGPAGVSGQFYCARAAKLREIWMPNGMPVEDGYVYGMIVTDGFRHEVDVRRVARAPDASHYFEALVDVRELMRHETRLVVGTALNAYFMWDFLRFATLPGGPGAGQLVREQLAADPEWYRRLMDNHIRARGRWVLPRAMVTRRFHGLRGLGWRGGLRRLPVALIGFLVDVPVMVAANRRLRAGAAVGFW